MGFYYVEADSEEEAMETDREDGVYGEYGNATVEEVEEFDIEL